MAKTKPIGVRFNKELLDAVAEKKLADSPQKALNLYESLYLKYVAGALNEQQKEEKKAFPLPPVDYKPFLYILNLAKEGASKEEVESEITKNKNLSPGQMDVIRRKITTTH